MSSDAGARAAPLTAAGRIETRNPRGGKLGRDDLGAFRALRGEEQDLVALRPLAEGLVLEHGDVREVVPWDVVAGVTLTYAEAGHARVPAARIRFASGPSLDVADAFAPGAASLPASLGDDAAPLLRVERFRMFVAAVAACAGLAPQTQAEFGRGPRGVPVPPLSAKPRVLPRAAPPVLLVASVAAIVFALRVRWGTAVAFTAVIAAHECGHVVAMRLLGLEVRGFLFVPLIGAVTLREHAFTSRWDEARVMLAGPVSGLPVAGALALLLATGATHGAVETAVAFALLSTLAVNLFNLLPLLPLDGGHLLNSATAAAPAAVRDVAGYLPIAAGAALVLPRLSDFWFFAAAAFLGLSFALTHATLRRQRRFAWTRGLSCGSSALRSSLRDVTFAFGGRAREDADGGFLPEPMSARQVRTVVVYYVAEIAALGVSSWLFLRWCPRALDWMGDGS